MDTVVCTNCGEENPAKFRLCGFCGTALTPVPETVICTSCGEENPGRFRLCGFCGTSLVGAATAPAPAVAAVAPGVAPIAPLPAQEVRKLVTLVFSDLKDSTALTASIDAEAMNEIKARYFGSMAVEIERHGGKVEKNIGDAIMAVFGLVRAREDDALRAVRAAAGMKDVLATLNEELQRFYGVTLTNRTGVNTGEIVANTDPNATQNLATGDAVNVAARLEQNAPANEVLMGEMTYELVRGHVDVERLELQLKGKAEPVPAFRLVGLRSQPATRLGDDSPFIGREFELDVLSGAFAQVASKSVGRLVAVIGDAGVGKTRLIADFLARVAGQATILRGRCLAYGDGITFWPLLEVVRAAARIAEDDSPEMARRKIAELLPAGDPDREAIVDRVTSAVGLSGASFPVAELFWGARKLLEAQAAQQPLVLVIDDIHSAEATFLEFLEHLVTTARGVSMLVLCTARPELLDEHVGWTEQAHAEQIDLQPLGAGDVEVMIDRLLGDGELSAATREKVIAAADGNPLYVEQMVSMVREHGSASGEIVVPPTISALIAARLDNLTREERAIVDPASVIGLVFPGPAIEELVPVPIRPTVSSHLTDLDRKQFVHPQAGGDDPAYRFHHILVRDAAYGSLLKRARATLHERFVDWAERVNRERDREKEFEEILGYHLEQAVRYRSELGPLDAAGLVLAERAATKLASAGRRAFSRGDTPAACNLLRRAVALLPTEAPIRVELLTELAEALMEEAGFDEAGAVLLEADELATRLADGLLLARASLGWRMLQLLSSSGSGIGDVLADAGRAIEAFEAGSDQAGLARAWRLLMFAHGTAGAYDEAAAAAERVVEHARAAGDGRMATRGAIGYAVSALHGPTPVPDAIATSERLLAEVAGDRKAEGIILGVLGQLDAMDGAFERARERSDRARQMLADLGPSVTAASTSIESSRIEMLAGSIDAAQAVLRRDHDVLEAMGEHYYLATIAGLLAHAQVEGGGLSEAEGSAQLAQRISDPDDIEAQILWRSALAKVRASQGDGATAQQLAQEAVELARTTVDLILQADALADYAAVMQRLGRDDESGPPLQEALSIYERKGSRAGAERRRARASDVAP
ncbi:MAG TPA: AAA family ATPase [Candidatus Limnocylindrales bacterium]|nr:AAA family ATPase [Candidatus Limnocylindrales bacterium]